MSDKMREFVAEVKQLCKDFSDQRDRPYMGDVHAALDGLYEQWQAAQSTEAVPVVGEPVAWGVTKRYEDNVWFISDSRFTAQYYAQMYAHRIGENPDQVVIPLYRKPATSITAAELATLREKAAEADELQKRAERMQKALSDIAEWTDRYTTPGHPVSTIASAAIAQGKGE